MCLATSSFWQPLAGKSHTCSSFPTRTHKTLRKNGVNGNILRQYRVLVFKQIVSYKYTVYMHGQRRVDDFVTSTNTPVYV